MPARFHLYRRNGTYYFRWTIPHRLRQHMPTGSPVDVRISLRTHHYPLARVLAARHWLAALDTRDALLATHSGIRYKALISAIRGRVCMTGTSSTSDASEKSVTVVSLLGSANRDALLSAIALLNDAGAPLSVFFSGPVNIYADRRDEDGDPVTETIDRLHDWVDEAILTDAGVFAAVAATGQDFALPDFRSNKPGGSEDDLNRGRVFYRIVPDTKPRYLLADIRTLPRFASVLDRTPAPATLPASAAVTPVASTRFNERLSTLASRWLDRQHQSSRTRAGWTDKTYKEYKAALNQCIEIVGDKFSGDLTPEDANHYIEVIGKLPRNYYQQRDKLYGGRSPTAVAKQSFPEDQLLSPKTLQDKTGMVSQFFESLSKDEYIGKNFFHGLFKLPKSYEPMDRREPFNDAALSAMFTGEGAALLAASLNNKNKIAVDFWGPLLGLFTGARAGEISQLACDDVKRTDTGTPYLSIVDNEIDETATGTRRQRLKTKNSRREVPLHPVLLDLGFMEFVALRAKSGARTPLFPESWTRKDPARVYQRLSTKFTAMLKALNLKTPKQSFHSFRHTVVQRFRSDSSHIYQAHQFCGHDNGLPKINTMQGTRYGGDFSVDELVPLLDLLKYPVNWADLKQAIKPYQYW